MTEFPVIFIVFNRPELTAQVFARIRAARPRALHVICDGPRATRPTDASRVAAVRALIAQGVDWPCTVTTDYAESNLGCRRRVASGLDAAFTRFEAAIILEDDCLPDPSFFPYCTTLLERYRDDSRVLHIAGTNLAPAASATAGSAAYRASHHPWIWGWATWRRAWQLNDFHMASWTERLPALRGSFASPWEAQYWLPTLDQARADLTRADTWGFPWMYSVRAQGGLSLLPTVNLIENLGVGPDSTHTKADSLHLRRPAHTLPLPLGPAPRALRVDRYADEAFTRAYCGHTNLAAALRSRLRTWRASLFAR
jgi:hypothetical protein